MPTSSTNASYHLMLARGHTGSFTMDAIAALDTAAWDIRGQGENARSLIFSAGPNAGICPTVSGLRVSGLDDKIKLARTICDNGYAGAEIFTGAFDRRGRYRVRSIRDAIPHDRFFAVDAICKYDLAEALSWCDPG